MKGNHGNAKGPKPEVIQSSTEVVHLQHRLSRANATIVCCSGLSPFQEIPNDDETEGPEAVYETEATAEQQAPESAKPSSSDSAIPLLGSDTLILRLFLKWAGKQTSYPRLAMAMGPALGIKVQYVGPEIRDGLVPTDNSDRDGTATPNLVSLYRLFVPGPVGPRGHLEFREADTPGWKKAASWLGLSMQESACCYTTGCDAHETQYIFTIAYPTNEDCPTHQDNRMHEDRPTRHPRTCSVSRAISAARRKLSARTDTAELPSRRPSAHRNPWDFPEWDLAVRRQSSRSIGTHGTVVAQEPAPYGEGFLHPGYVAGISISDNNDTNSPSPLIVIDDVHASEDEQFRRLRQGGRRIRVILSSPNVQYIILALVMTSSLCLIAAHFVRWTSVSRVLENRMLHVVSSYTHDMKEAWRRD